MPRTIWRHCEAKPLADPSPFSVVLDASVALAAIFPDEVLNAHALKLLSDLNARGALLVSPVLWESETSSAVRFRVAVRKTLAPTAEATVYALLDALPVHIVHDPDLILRARALALAFGRTRVYDATYLALAQLHGLDFWTGDERLYNAVNGPDTPKGAALSFVRYIGHLKP